MIILPQDERKKTSHIIFSMCICACLCVFVHAVFSEITRFHLFLFHNVYFYIFVLNLLSIFLYPLPLLPISRLYLCIPLFSKNSEIIISDNSSTLIWINKEDIQTFINNIFVLLNWFCHWGDKHRLKLFFQNNAEHNGYKIQTCLFSWKLGFLVGLFDCSKNYLFLSSASYIHLAINIFESFKICNIYYATEKQLLGWSCNIALHGCKIFI